MIIKSNPINIKTNSGKLFCTISEKAIFAIFINIINCGIINGNPSIAMMAEGCCALEAMAAKKLNTKLKLIPPKQLMPKNNQACCKGLPSNTVNNNKLSPLISVMSKLL